MLTDVRGNRIGGRVANGGQRRRATCHRGHDLAAAYICVSGTGGTYRRCRDCERQRYQERKEHHHA